MKNKRLQSIMFVLFFTPIVFVVNDLQAKGFAEISAKQLKARMENGQKLLLVNPMSELEYNTKHIPGSVNIPLENIMITEKLPKDKKQLIVTYCLGRNCIYSTDAARLIANKGYTNIMVFRDGIPGWIEAGYTTESRASRQNTNVKIIKPEQLHAALDDYLVVDIRPASAYESGYLPNSRAMPMAFLSKLAVELPKARSIAVIDHSGKQSKKAAQWLLNNGFQDVSVVSNGMVGYSRAGFSLEK